MQNKMLSGLAAMLAAAALAGYFAAETSADRTKPRRPAAKAKAKAKPKASTTTSADSGGVAGMIGPDVTIGSMNGTSTWASNATMTVYSFGTTSCNIGDMPLNWDDNNGQDDYPVIGQNMYKVTADGRFEHIGQGWLKHAFCALQGANLCPVGGQACQPVCGGCCDELGVGCSDPYGAGLNGSQPGLGPKWQINANTGTFAVPHADPPYDDDFDRRVQVLNADLSPTFNPGALYFIEGHYIAKDDAAWGNQNNNTSYRRVNVGAAPSYFLSFMPGQATHQEKSGIHAWRDNDPHAGDGDPSNDVQLVNAQVPGEGLFILGYKVLDNGNGTWHYEYVLYNMNSDRSAMSFSVPVGGGVQLTNIGFRDVPYHSGDGPGGVTYDGTDWSSAIAGGAMTWSTQTFAQNPSANAVRWGTAYTFRFDADSGPAETDVEFELFKPGTPGVMIVPAMGPAPKPTCDGDATDDGVVDVSDLITVLTAWGTGAPAADFDGSGVVDVTDLLTVLTNWGVCD
jgi:hypothetical protein